MSNKTLSLLSRLADGVAASLLVVIFGAFILQIALRYLFNWPVGWTSELSVSAWLWLVLFGSAFALRDAEEIRIDFIYANVGWRVRRIRLAMRGIVGLARRIGGRRLRAVPKRPTLQLAPSCAPAVPACGDSSLLRPRH